MVIFFFVSTRQFLSNKMAEMPIIYPIDMLLFLYTTDKPKLNNSSLLPTHTHTHTWENKTKQNRTDKLKPKPSIRREMASVWNLWQPLLDCSGPIATSGAPGHSSYLLTIQSLWLISSFAGIPLLFLGVSISVSCNNKILWTGWLKQ